MSLFKKEGAQAKPNSVWISVFRTLGFEPAIKLFEDRLKTGMDVFKNRLAKFALYKSAGKGGNLVIRRLVGFTKKVVNKIINKGTDISAHPRNLERIHADGYEHSTNAADKLLYMHLYATRSKKFIQN